MPEGVFQALGLDFTPRADPLRLTGRAAFSGKNASGSVCEHSARSCHSGAFPSRSATSSRPSIRYASLSRTGLNAAATPHAEGVFVRPVAIRRAPFGRPHRNYTRVIRAASSRRVTLSKRQGRLHEPSNLATCPTDSDPAGVTPASASCVRNRRGGPRHADQAVRPYAVVRLRAGRPAAAAIFSS
jgi:hypothetical protein